MSSTYQHTNSSVYLLNYHFVFCPKRRRKVLVGKLKDRLNELLEQKASELNWNIISMEIMPDHVHMFMAATPQTSPRQIMHRLKGYTARILRQEFPELMKMPSLWTRSFFVSTAGNVSSKKIQHYIKTQRTRD